MQKIIILIGHDTSGKSHIAKALSEKLQLPIIKLKYPKHFWDPVIAQRYSQETITQILEQTGISCILDRGFPCDAMYASLFDRSYDMITHAITDDRFSKMNTTIVHCFKETEKFQHDEEDKDFVSIEDYSKMIKIYKNILQHSNCKVIELNTSNEDLDYQLTTIINNICE